MQKLILGKYDKLPEFDAPWRFIPEYIPQDYSIGFHNDPFNMIINGQPVTGVPYSESNWEYEILDGFNGKAGYDGIKIGDVSSPAQLLCDHPVQLSLPSVLLAPEETYVLTFTPNGFDSLVAFQLGMFIDHDQLEVLSVQVNNLPGFEDEEHLNLAEIEENKLAMLWFKKDMTPLSISATAPLFSLEVKAKVPVTDLGSALNLNPESSFYQIDGCEKAVTLEVVAEQVTENINGGTGERSGSSRHHASNSLFCAPNPFTDGVQVYFDNPVDETGLVVISDMSGKVVFKDDIFIQKGVNALILPNDRFGAAPYGTFRLTLTTQKNVRHASLIKL